MLTIIYPEGTVGVNIIDNIIGAVNIPGIFETIVWGSPKPIIFTDIGGAFTKGSIFDAYVVKRVMSDIQSTIVNVGQNLDPEAIDKATDLLANAKSITFFGLGGSGPVALDAQHKFFRFGVPVVAHTDYINQRMIVSMMKEGDLLVLISFTGRTTEIVETAKIAKKNGVKTIALTSEDSPLARLSDIVLHIHTHLENNLHIPMTSRLAHLAIIDILSATVQARFGKVFDSRKDEVIKNIEKTRV